MRPSPIQLPDLKKNAVKTEQNKRFVARVRNLWIYRRYVNWKIILEIFQANISRKIAKLLKRNWDAHGFESLEFLVTYLNLLNYLLYEKFIID